MTFLEEEIWPAAMRTLTMIHIVMSEPYVKRHKINQEPSPAQYHSRDDIERGGCRAGASVTINARNAAGAAAFLRDKGAFAFVLSDPCGWPYGDVADSLPHLIVSSPRSKLPQGIECTMLAVYWKLEAPQLARLSLALRFFLCFFLDNCVYVYLSTYTY